MFVREQGIDAHMVWDEADATAVHALVANHLGEPIATGRLLQCEPREGQTMRTGRVWRMAVSRPLRGSHLGSDELNGLEQAAQARGDVEVMLHAQCTAEGFYARNGFVTRGDVFEAARIRHIEMA